MIGVRPKTLNNWRYEKPFPRGPRYSRVGGRIVYPIAELERYLEENMV